MTDDLPDWYTKPPPPPSKLLDSDERGLLKKPSEILAAPISYDLRAHFDRVRRLHETSPWLDEKRCRDNTLSLMRSFLDRDRLPSENVLQTIRRVIDKILRMEGLYQPTLRTPDWNNNTPNWVEVIERPLMKSAEQFYLSFDERMGEASRKLDVFFTHFLELAPELLFDEVAEATHIPTVYFFEISRDTLRGLSP